MQCAALTWVVAMKWVLDSIMNFCTFPSLITFEIKVDVSTFAESQDI